MTQVQYSRHNNEYHIKIQGHSDGEKNEHGHDLVCCACSTVGFMLANAINNMEYAEKLIYDATKPIMEFKFVTRNNVLIGIIDNAMDTFKALEEQYPENILLKFDVSGRNF